MKKLCKDFRDQAMKIINYETKEMILLTDEETEFMKTKKFVTYVKMNLVLIKMIKIRLNDTIKSEITVITQENLEEPLIVVAI